MWAKGRPWLVADGRLERDADSRASFCSRLLMLKGVLCYVTHMQDTLPLPHHLANSEVCVCVRALSLILPVYCPVLFRLRHPLGHVGSLIS